MKVNEVEHMLAAMAVELDRNPSPELGKQIEELIHERVAESIRNGNCENPGVCLALMTQTSQLLMQG